MASTTDALLLGLDLGSNSIGWALLKGKRGKGPDPVPTEIVDMGVRVFESGSDGELEKGSEESRGVQRRDKRQLRKQHDRAARRIDFVYLLLQTAGLLPALPEGNPVRVVDGIRIWRDRTKAARAARARLRHQVLNRLDAQLFDDVGEVNRKTVNLGPTDLAQRLTYFLRTVALDEPLPPYALGRALFHLAQRRGYLSNRKADKEDDEESGKVKDGIRELEAAMRDRERRTLAELFLHEPGETRIRGKWTSRQMYVDEFNAIWDAQKNHAPDLLNDVLRDRLFRAIFRQRPLKSAAKFIGLCEWERNRRRAPKCLLASQRFRMLQQLNNTRVREGDAVAERPLDAGEREKILDRLEYEGDLTFKGALKLLGLKKAKFNYEAGGETRFLGNRTSAKLAGIFGAERWRAMSAAERDRVVDDWRSIEKDRVLERRGREVWGLSPDAAEKFAKLTLEPGYGALSRRALGKLLPRLEAGEAYMEACLAVYGERKSGIAVEELPPVEKVLPSLRNPTVERILTELRKVMNAVVRRYGKPDVVRIELARELRKSRKSRQNAWKRMRDQEKRRLEAGKSLLDELGMKNPSRRDIEKCLLFLECGKVCPYTGRSISMKALFDGEVDVEHIVPFSVSFDNSFLNKTLCYRDANARKGNRTPWEAFGHDEQLWHEMTLRVKKFPGGAYNLKVQRFLAEEHPDLEGFARQQLTDTSYASKEAVRYLGLLYGDDAAKHVQAARGGVTAFLRGEWGLNAILGDGGGKSRDDHRHHAVDALVVAFTDRRVMKQLSDAAVRAAKAGRRLFAGMPEPWDGFVVEARDKVDGLVVSRRVSRKVSGALHEDTYYSPSKGEVRGKGNIHHVRKPVAQLKEKDIDSDDSIVDKAVRDAVRAALKRLPKADPKLFDLPEHMPYLTARDGRRIPIRKVRLRFVKSGLLSIGEDASRRRQAVGGNNHHAEIVALLDGKGETVGMDWVMVSMYEAYRRKKAHEPIVRRDHGEGRKFLFSLAAGDVVMLRDGKGNEELYACRGTNKDLLAFTRNNDARKQEDIKADKAFYTIQSGKKLMQSSLRKISITPLGEMRAAHD